MNGDETTTLFRPVGPKELALIAASGYHAFPPRLPQQPIFYPVLTEAYGAKIARDWNAKDPSTGYRGYIPRFRVRRTFLAHYDVQQAGGAAHQEYWIPAADRLAFNENIVGEIEVVAEFRGAEPET